MNIIDFINARRSIKTFSNRPVTQEEIEQLLSAACQAPNHRMTEPWRFYVLGPQSRRAYGEALGRRKANRVDDPEAAKAVVEKVAETHEALPAMLFFQLINRRYERASTVLTSNKGFEEWGQILGDEVMAAALIDRLLHHCHIVNIRGSSYRMRKHTDLSKILHSPPAESTPSPPKRKRARAKEKTTN